MKNGVMITARCYAGIGSRRTPAAVMQEITKLARQLRYADWTLRTGGCNGADQAFAEGAGITTNIFLPWSAYNQGPIGGVDQRCVILASPTVDAIKTASEYHPAWHQCSVAARRFHGRNVHIILGPELTNPVEFVICWTPTGGVYGGTGMGMRVAQAKNIPVFNLFDSYRPDKYCEKTKQQIVEFVGL